MSQQSKLRFQNLPGKDEALALEKLVKKGRSELCTGTPHVPVPLISNLIINALEQKKGLDFLLSPKDLVILKTFLKKNGLDHLCIDLSELQDRERLNEKCQYMLQYQEKSIDNDGSWRRFFKLIEQLSYGDFVVGQIGMGEKPLHAIMERYLQLKSRYDNVLLEECLRRSDYDFNAKEFWHIRGRIRDAKDRFQPQFDNLETLDRLHPVFVEMYRPEEAKDLIKELLVDLQRQLTTIQEQFHHWILSYRQHYLTELSEFGLLVRDHAFSIATEASDLLDSDNASRQTSWSWLAKSQNDPEELAEEQIRSAYNSLRKMIDERGLSSIFELPQAHDTASIRDVLSTLLNKFHSTRRKVKRFVDDHIGRVNNHNIKTAIHAERYEILKSRITQLLTDINGKQVFKEYWEDNTLDILSQKKWLDKACDQLKTINRDTSNLKDYLEWKQYLSLIDRKDENILEALKKYPKPEWLDRFDLWYYENFIEAQDLIPLDYNAEIGKFSRFTNTLFKSNWHNSISRSTHDIQTPLTSFLKKNKKIKAWMEKGQNHDFSALKPDLLAFSKLFPIRILSDADRNDLTDRWLIHQSDQQKDAEGMKIITGTEGSHAGRYLPSITADIIHSRHSERIHAIKLIAQQFLSWQGELEIWQNQHQVYLSMAVHGGQDLLFKWMNDDLRRSRIKRFQDIDVLVETLLNNSDRQFYALFTQHHTWDTNNWAFQLEHQRWMAFSKFIGLQPLYVSWHSIFKNAEFIAFLERERSKGQKQKSISPQKS